MPLVLHHPAWSGLPRLLGNWALSKGATSQSSCEPRKEGFRKSRNLLPNWRAWRVEVIAAFGDLAPKAVQQETQTIPIVAMADDMLGAGIVSSLSRPGGNTTGVTIIAPELSQKRLEVLREMLPGIRRVPALGPFDGCVASLCH